MPTPLPKAQKGKRNAWAVLFTALQVETGLFNADLAAKMGMCEASFYHAKNGLRAITPQAAIGYARNLGVSEARFLVAALQTILDRLGVDFLLALKDLNKSEHGWEVAWDTTAKKRFRLLKDPKDAKPLYVRHYVHVVEEVWASEDTSRRKLVVAAMEQHLRSLGDTETPDADEEKVA